MISAVIVAAGDGLRMGKTIRKQYIHINGVPLLCLALKTFDECSKIDRIYLAVPRFDKEICQKLIATSLKLIHQVFIISGGSTRQSSVLNALDTIALNTTVNNTDIVIIHDGARPFVTKKLILDCIKGVGKTGACILAIPAADSLKFRKNNDFSAKTMERKNVWMAQTPQAFNFNIIFTAYNWAKKNKLQCVDDSSIAEMIGSSINIVHGHSYNIKITTEHDLILAEAIAKIIQS